MTIGKADGSPDEHRGRSFSLATKQPLVQKSGQGLFNGPEINGTGETGRKGLCPGLLQVGVGAGEEFDAAFQATEIVPLTVIKTSGALLGVNLGCAVGRLARLRPRRRLVDLFAAHQVLGHTQSPCSIAGNRPVTILGQNPAPAARGQAGPAGRLTAVLDWVWDSLSGPLFYAALELWVAARTDPELHAIVYQFERRVGKAMAQLWHEFAGDIAETKPEFEAVLELTFHVMRGMALQKILRDDDKERRRLFEIWKRLVKFDGLYSHHLYTHQKGRESST